MSIYPVHEVFISYHHQNDNAYKEELISLNKRYKVFIDKSVDTGDIDPNLPPQSIRTEIRDNYLRNSTVTLLLVGTETKKRKHIDWELYSSMIDGQINKKSGIIVVQLPSTYPEYFTAAYGDVEKAKLYPQNCSWTSIDSRTEYEHRYPFLPSRIIDQLLAKDVKISVSKWEIVIENNLSNLAFLIDCAYNARSSCNYDLPKSMKMRNS